VDCHDRRLEPRLTYALQSLRLAAGPYETFRQPQTFPWDASPLASRLGEDYREREVDEIE